MKISTKTFNLIAYISLAILVILLIGMLTRVIPPEYYLHALTVAIALFLLRIFLRIQMYLQSKSSKRNEN
jgi:hypothetical protein